MPDLGTAYVQIVPSARGISGKIQQAIDPGAAQAGLGAGRTIASNIGGALSKAGSGMIKAGAIATAVAVPIVAGFKSALSAYEVQNMAETKLTEIYRTRMGVSKQAAKATMELASALQQEGVIGDEVQLSGAQQLATFAKYPSTVNTLLPAMNNLLAQQKGVNASAEDATNIGNLMGKVLQGQVGALKRVGISFDENQEKILKNGNEQERAAMLAEVITSNVGNMNKTLAETPLGQIQQMKNTFGDLTEQIGGMLAPVLSQLANWISASILPAIQNIINVMQANPVIAQVAAAITGILAIGGPLLALIGALTSSIGGVVSVLAGLSAPVLGAVGAIAGIVAVFALAYAKSETFRNAVNGLVKTIGSALEPIIQSAIGFFKALIDEVMSVAQAIGDALAPVIQLLTPVIQLLVKLVGVRLKTAFTVIIAVVKTVSAAIKAVAAIIQGVFTAINGVIQRITGPIKKAAATIQQVLSFAGLGGKVKGIFNKIKEFMEHPFQTAKDTIKSIIDKVKGYFPFSIGKIISGMKLPHITISGKFSLDPPSAPHFGIDWYAKGGIMTQPTLFGGGEAGPEAILPLDPFWKKLETMSGGNTYNVTMSVNGAENPEDWAERFARKLEMKARAY